MITQKELEEYIASMPNARLEYPFDEKTAVYKLDDKMFAIIPEGKATLSVSLRCDFGLSKVLRDKYETVMPGQRLNKKQWNTILLTGQLTWEEVQDLIRHSYNLVAEQS